MNREGKILRCNPVNGYNQNPACLNKSVDILQSTGYQQADIRMRSHGLRQLVDDKSVANVWIIERLVASCFNKF